jgi:hypothetical protein
MKRVRNKEAIPPKTIRSGLESELTLEALEQISLEAVDYSLSKTNLKQRRSKGLSSMINNP